MDSANAPWSWNDKDDGPLEGGEIATDPAKLADHYFTSPMAFSRTCTFNPFRVIGSADEP